MTKCEGCGGITNNQLLCERCFRIRHYNEYKKINANNDEYIKILNSIPPNDLILLVVDLFNFNNLEKIKPYLNKNVVLVLTKRDLLPKRIDDEKLLSYDYNVDSCDKIIVSSNNNYNLDNLYNLIYKYKNSNKVYIIGYTNAGKSSLINKLIYNYSTNQYQLTTSPLPSTTLALLELVLNEELIIVDTPGIIDDLDIINYIDPTKLKNIVPHKEIKPITYQIKSRQTILVDDVLRIDTADTNITFYVSNKLEIKRNYKAIDDLKSLCKHCLKVQRGQDIVIQGLGFIKVSKKCQVELYVFDNVGVYLRKSLI